MHPFLLFLAAIPALLPQTPPEPLHGGRLLARPLQHEPEHSRALERLAPFLRNRLEALDVYVLQVPEAADPDRLAAELQAGGDFEYVHEDPICSPAEHTPNDPWYGQQWHHRVMLSALAWDVSTGGGSGYIASWVDTGVDLTHPDLAGALIPGYNSADRIEQASGGDVHDINGHGTAVAGCIGAIGNNGIGVAGVNWNVQLMPVRTTNMPNGDAYLDDLLDGVLWAVNHGARSVSVSYTGVEYPEVGAAGDAVHNLGAVLVWAAGNSSTDLSWFDWPNVVIVGATNSGDHKTSWSSYGLAVDNVAPGEFITTTAPGGGYWSVSGTSFSAPLTNGSLALLWAAHPGWSNDQVLDKLFSSCDDLGAFGEDNVYGHGRINLARALDAPGQPPRLHLSMSYPQSGQTCTFTVSSATAGGTVYYFYAARFGTTPWPQLGVDLGLRDPIVQFGTSAVNAVGESSYSVFLPLSYRGRTAWVQAAETGAISELILVQVF